MCIFNNEYLNCYFFNVCEIIFKLLKMEKEHYDKNYILIRIEQINGLQKIEKMFDKYNFETDILLYDNTKNIVFF